MMFYYRDIVLVDRVNELLDFCIDLPAPDQSTVPKKVRIVENETLEPSKPNMNPKVAVSTPDRGRQYVRSPTVVNKATTDLNILEEDDQENDSSPNSPTTSPRKKPHRMSCQPKFQNDRNVISLNELNVEDHMLAPTGILY